MTIAERTEPVHGHQELFSRERLDRLGMLCLSIVFLFIVVSGTWFSSWPNFATFTQLLACLALIAICVGESVRLAIRISKLPHARTAVRVVVSTSGFVATALSASLASHWIQSVTHAPPTSAIHTLAVLTSLGTAICWTAILGVLLALFGISWLFIGAAHSVLLQLWNTALVPIIAFIPALRAKLRTPDAASRTIVQGIAAVFTALALIEGSRISIAGITEHKEFLSNVVVMLDFYDDHRCPLVTASAPVNYVGDKLVNIAEKTPKGWTFRLGLCRPV